MSYKKNEDGTYTCFRLMKFDNTVLQATAQTLDNAKELLKKEVQAYKNYALEITKKVWYTNQDGEKFFVQANDGLADIINREVEENNENS